MKPDALAVGFVCAVAMALGTRSFLRRKTPEALGQSQSCLAERTQVQRAYRPFMSHSGIDADLDTEHFCLCGEPVGNSEQCRDWLACAECAIDVEVGLFAARIPDFVPTWISEQAIGGDA